MARCILFRSEVLQHIHLTQKKKHSSIAQKVHQMSASFLAQASLCFFTSSANVFMLCSYCVRTTFGAQQSGDHY